MKSSEREICCSKHYHMGSTFGCLIWVPPIPSTFGWLPQMAFGFIVWNKMHITCHHRPTPPSKVPPLPKECTLTKVPPLGVRKVLTVIWEKNAIVIWEKGSISQSKTFHDAFGSMPARESQTHPK